MKKSVVIAAIMLIHCATSVWAGELAADANDKSSFFNSESFSAAQKHPEITDNNLSSELHRILVAILIVVLLGTATIYASKKVLPKWSAAQGKKIKVIETVHLGTRKAVHLLEIGNQQILIGSTHDKITKLADIFSEKGFPLSQIDNSGDAE